MNSKKLTISLLVVSVFYIIVFIFLDKYGVLSKLKNLTISNILVLFSLFFLSIFCRYVRWYLLLKNQSLETHFFYGFVAYTAGFLYTATPGKLGELSRVCFYRGTEVKKENIISAFIFERTFDLLVVLSLSVFIAFNNPVFKYISYFVFFIVLMILLGSFFTYFLKGAFYRYKLFDLIVNVFRGVRENLTIKISLLSFMLGYIAWGITSYILIYILDCLSMINGFNLNLFSVYPISMLAGAATFIPGGIGTTESTIAYLLVHLGIKMEDAFLVAVLARFSTIWMATIMGLVCSWCVFFIARQKEY